MDNAYICYDGTHETSLDGIPNIVQQWNNILAVPENVFNLDGTISTSSRDIRKQRLEEFLRLFTRGGDMTPQEVLRICHNYKVYPSSGVTDQGSASTPNSLKYLLNQIGSEYATIVFVHTREDTNTNYNFLTGVTIPNNVVVYVENGAMLNVATGVTITSNGIFTAPRVKCINCTGTGILTFAFNCGMDSVCVEWFGTDGTALSKASRSARAAYLDLTIGNSNINIENETVIINNNYSNIKGSGCSRSRITIGETGSLQVKRGVEGYDLRGLGFEDLLITSTGTTNKLVEFVKDLSMEIPFAGSSISFHRCRLSGGKYSIYSSGSVIQLTFDKTIISNNGEDKYAIYIDQQSPPATPYFNGLNIVQTRIEGNCYIKMDRNLNINGSIIECTDGTSNVKIESVQGGGIINSYFETEGQTVIEIGDDVYGFQIMGNMVDSGWGQHIICGGKSCVIGANRFVSITAAQPVIELTSSSLYCRVLENYGGDYEGIPKVSNDGSYNEIWGAKEYSTWIPAESMIPRQGTEYKNFVSNGDFEIYDSTGEDFPSTTFEGWDLNSVDENNKIIVTTDSFRGETAAKIIKTDTNCYLSKTIDISNLPERRLINLSFRAHGDGINSGEFRVYDVTNGSVAFPKTSTEAPYTNLYRLWRVNFIRPVGCNTIRIEFYPSGSVGASEAYFDDVSLSVQGDTVSMFGMRYYSLPKGESTSYETCIKLPNNIIKQNGTNTAKLLFQTYFMCSPGIESDVLADFYWGYSLVTENTVPSSSLTYVYAEPGSHLPLTGGNILKMLTCSSGTIVIPDLNSNILRIVFARGGTGSYPSDLRFFGLMVKILHVTT
jgi:hypothetical protein